MWCTVYVIVESTEVQMTWQQPVYIWLGGGKKCSRQAGSCFSTILPFLFSFFIFKQKQDTVPKHSTPPHLLWFLLSTTTMPSCLQLYRGKSKQTCEMALVSNKNKQTNKKGQWEWEWVRVPGLKPRRQAVSYLSFLLLKAITGLCPQL